MNYSKRVIICSLVAIASGLSCSYLGGQISLTSRSNQCQANPVGFQTICSVLATPDALLQGSTRGLWMGTILGAFIAGLATRDRNRNNEG